MRNYFILLIVLIVCFAVGYAAGRFITPTKIVEKTIEVEKIAEKEVIKKDVQTQIIYREIKKPDGTIEITKVETQIDKTVSNTESFKETTKEISKETINKKQQFLVAALIAFKDFELKPTYGVSIDKTFIGPVTIGGYYVLPKDFGLRIGLMF